MNSTFKPAGHRVLVKAHADEPAQEGGSAIIIPGSVGIGPHIYKCEVVDVGDPVTKCKVGDIVVIPMCGYEILLNMKGHRVVPEDDILGVLTESVILRN